MSIKILTYNVHKLFNITGRNYFLSSLKDILSEMDLDMVFLQEIPGFLHEQAKESFSADPLEHLADNLWDHFVYGKNAITTKGDHGNAILSKYPFQHSDNHNISNHPWEQRGLLLGKTEIEGKKLALGCTHLDLTYMGRKRQVTKIGEILQGTQMMEQPFIFCGDFNDWNGQTTKLITKLGLQGAPDQLVPTYPSFFPVLSLDRIFFRNIHCVDAKVLNDEHWKKFSDHLPMYAEFEF